MNQVIIQMTVVQARMRRLLVLLASVAIALLACACGGAVETPSPAPAPSNAPVCAPDACGWKDNPETGTQSCSSPFTFAQQQRFEELDDGASSCWIYDTVCVAQGTPAECVPDACRREHVTCQPTQPMGQP